MAEPSVTRVCCWCGREGADELVNRKRWYHKACIALLDMVSQ